MNKTVFRKILYTLFFFLLILLILTDSQTSLRYALKGLNLWFEKMVPSLLPFMILSGIMVRMGLTEGFASLAYPLLSPLLRIDKNAVYACVMGFLCGFPMGARVICELLERNKITKEEGNYLLAFCNNIGPVYFCSFVLPLLHRKRILPYLLGMYGLPLLYGWILRNTVYRDLAGRKKACKENGKISSWDKVSLLGEIDDAIQAGIQGILTLGGYMILFNLLNILPNALLRFGLPRTVFRLTAPLLEITGGLGMLGDMAPLWSLLLLPFGGLSCIAQTYSIIKDSGLSLCHYVLHKLILTALTLFYYLAWACLSPATFLL